MLSPAELKSVREILLAGFTLAGLDELMLDIDKRREQFALGDDLREIVRKVVDRGSREGWLQQFLLKAAAANPKAEKDLATAGIMNRLELSDVDRSEVFETYYFRRRPLIDHEDLRPMLRSLCDDTDEGARILIVRGERYSGKSYTIDFINHLSTRLGFHVTRIELSKHAAGRELTPDIVGQAIVEEMNLNDPMPEVGHDQMAWWTTHYLSWLVKTLRGSDAVWWIVLDDFHQLAVPPAVYEFIEEMALKIDGALPGIRLVLIGFDRQLPEKVEPIVETYTTGAINELHVADYFTRFLRDYVPGATLEEAPSQIAASVKRVRDVMNERDARGRLSGMTATIAKESRRLRGSAGAKMIRPVRWTDSESAGVRSASLKLLDTMIPAPVVTAPAATRYSPAHEAAAVVATFRVDPASRATDRELESLLRDALQLPGATGEEWTLQADVRMEVMHQLIADGRLAKVLGEQHRSDDPLSRALSAAVEGSPALRDLDAASLSALSPLLPLFPDMPAPELQRWLELSRILDPFRHLVGTFRGRAKELSQLRRYVGVLAPGSSLERVPQALSLGQASPFLVVGPGGVGKSTLIARFILDHVQNGDAERLPFAYIDFDRPLASVEEPGFLLMEVVRQIGHQYAEAGVAAVNLRHDWSELFAPGLREEPSRTARIVRDFGAFLDTLHIREKPLLLVLDTFEEIHYRIPSYVGRLGALLDEIRERIPRLRTVIASRAEVPGLRVSEVMRLGDLDSDAALEFLLAQGVRDENAARDIIRQVGGHPLSLHLAAAVFHQEGAFPARQITGDPSGSAPPSQHFVQGLLYRRILGHIHDDEVRRLVHPGLVLRLVTPDVISRVLAGPCGLVIQTDQDAQRLFDQLSKEVALILVVAPDVVAFRPDVRRVVLPAVRAADPELVRQIHSSAADYYGKRGDDVSRAEEIYHLLSLGEPAAIVDRRFSEGVLPHLKDAVEDLPLPQKAYLSEKLGRDLSEEEWAAAEFPVWERAAVRQVYALLTTREYQKSLRILEQRQERSRASPLFLLETNALAALGFLEEAAGVAEHGIQAYRESTQGALLLSILESSAEIQWRLGNPEAAEQRLLHAQDLAMQLEDLDRHLRVAMALARVSESTRGKPDPDQRDRVLALALQRPPELLQRDPDFYRELLFFLDDRAAALGKDAEEALESERRRRRANRGHGQDVIFLSPDRKRLAADLLTQLFPTQQELRRFVSDHLDRSLDSLTLAGSLREIVVEVLIVAEENAWLGDLLLAARAVSGLETLRLFDELIPAFLPQGNEAQAALSASELRDCVSRSRLAFASIEAALGRLEIDGTLVASAWALAPRFAVCASASLGTGSPGKIELQFDALKIDGWVSRGDRFTVESTCAGPRPQAAFLRLKRPLGISANRRLPSNAMRAEEGVRECLWIWHSENGLRISGVRRVEDVGDYSFVLPTSVAPIAAGALCVDAEMNPIGILVSPGSGSTASLVLRLRPILENLPS